MVEIIKNKKGSIEDLILIMTVLLFFGMVVLLGFKITSTLNDEVQGNSQITADAKAATSQLTNYFPSVIDKTFIILLIGLTVGALILATLVRVHPIFIPLFITAWIFIVYISGILSNIYQEMASNPVLITQANQLTVITSVLTYLPIIIGGVGMLLMIVMYKQWSTA